MGSAGRRRAFAIANTNTHTIRCGTAHDKLFPSGVQWAPQSRRSEPPLAGSRRFLRRLMAGQTRVRNCGQEAGLLPPAKPSQQRASSDRFSSCPPTEKRGKKKKRKKSLGSASKATEAQSHRVVTKLSFSFWRGVCLCVVVQVDRQSWVAWHALLDEIRCGTRDCTQPGMEMYLDQGWACVYVRTSV
jgi:hypothetical protein